VRLVGPHDVGGVPVVDQVGGLDAGGHPQLGEPRQVGVVDQLGVLQGAGGSGAGEGVQYGVHRQVPDGMYGGSQPGGPGPGHQRLQLLGGNRVHPVAPRTDRTLVGLAAPRRATGDRPVDDDLERPHLHHRTGSRRLPGGQMPTGCLLESGRVDSYLHPHRAPSGGLPGQPQIGTARELHVADPDHATGGRGATALVQPAVESPGGDLGQPDLGGEGVGLGEEAGPVRHPQTLQRGRVAPGGVQIRRDDGHRSGARHGVQIRGAGIGRPAGGSQPESLDDPVPVRLGDGIQLCGDLGQDLLGPGGLGDLQTP